SCRCLSRLQKHSTLAKLIVNTRQAFPACRVRKAFLPVGNRLQVRPTLENLMKNNFRIFGFFVLLVVLSAPTLADTIRLKDGNVIRGQVIGFKDQQFTVLVGSGAQGRRSRTLVYVEDVESIEFDSATTAAAAGLANDDGQTSNNPAPTYQPPPRSTPSPV